MPLFIFCNYSSFESQPSLQTQTTNVFFTRVNILRLATYLETTETTFE
ncbi:13074_t:CDS:1, partial [Funneliformis caledonium]